MKRSLCVAVVALLAGLGGAGSARAAELPCGLPQTSPLWIEFADASVGFRFTVFARPGLVLASAGVTAPAQLRALGAQTVFWWMKLQRLVGTPKAPADPTSIQAAAEDLLARAIKSSGCETPVIALNELFGPHRKTPWVYETVIYRRNILSLAKALAAKGAFPYLLVPGPPRGNRSPWVDGEATAWWQELSKYAHIVRQMHFNAPTAHRRGPIVGSRARRVAMRDALEPFVNIGIPAERLGILVGFQSGPGKGGREGLEPREAWLEVVKREALAARQVATELGISSIWSWGWGTFDEAGADPDKLAAACVYLWTRDPSLCDGLGAAGPRFNPSLTEGQINLAPGVQCRTGLGLIEQEQVELLAELVGRGPALTALLNRLVYERERVGPSDGDLERVEAWVIQRFFDGDAAAYESALAERGLSPSLGRELLADQIRKQSYSAHIQIRHLASWPPGFLVKQQRRALRTAVCLRDELPPTGAFDWGGTIPFLDLPVPSLSIAADRYRVKRGTRITLSGRLRTQLGGETVTIYGRSAGASAFSKVRAVRLAADGRWRLRVKAGRTSHYRALSTAAVSPAIVVRTTSKR